jgi:hypothetical protein
MVFSSDLGGDELYAQFVGTLAEAVENALAIPFLVVVLALIGVFLTLGEHGVAQPGEFVSGSGHSLGFVHA